MNTEVALALPEGTLRDAILYALRELAVNVVYDHADTRNWTGVPAAVQQSGAQVLIFDLIALDEPTLTQALAALKARTPHLRTIAAYPYDDPAKIMLAMRAGANEFVHSPLGPALAAAFRRFAQFPVPPAPVPEKRGGVIGFVSAKAGGGATTVACHIAVDLKRRTGKETLLAELDLSPGPLDFLMKSQSQYSTGDAFESAGRLDANLWPALLAHGRTGVFVLPAPAKLLPGDLQSERVKQVIRFMRTQHDWVVLDFGRGLNPLLAPVAEELDELFLITTIDLPSLQMAKSMLRALPGAFGDVPVRLVLNRTQKALDVSVDEIQKIFGRPVHACLPDDFASLYTAYVNGGLSGADGPLSAAYQAIASQILRLSQ